MRINLHPAFILHSRPYTETSSLLEVFTQDYGRIALIARGARTARSALRGLLRPFKPLLMSWSGKTELMALTAAEQNGGSYELMGNALLSGMYLNELLVKLLQRFDAYPEIFTAYQQTLCHIQYTENIEKSLRLFEKNLFQALGYGLMLNMDSENDNEILPHQYYHFEFEKGFIPSETTIHSRAFLGEHLLSFHREELSCSETLLTAKRITRQVLGFLLGDKILKSRDLFRVVK
jgi:DNA repair protein RecO (recombination protein O)